MIRASVVLAVAVLFVAGGAGNGAAGAGPGRIVFSSFLPEYPLPNNFQVDRTFVVGKSDRELAVDDVLSPDGSRLATVRGGTELWVSNVDGTKLQRVAAAAVPIVTVIWSHDGSRLAFAAGSVWVVGADGADLHEVFAPSSVKIVLPRYGAWAPDDKHLVAFAGDGLWLLAADGATQRSIFRPATTPAWADEGVYSIDWAPKTSALALTIGTNAGCGPGIYENCFDWYVVTYDRAGDQLANIGEGLDVAWSPDGKKLAFATGPFLLEPEAVEIESAFADGSHRQEVTHAVSKLDKDDCWQYPTWVDDATIAFDETAAECQPDYANPELGFVVVRSRAVAWRSRGKDEVFSADGGRVAFLERVHGHSALFTADLAAAQPRASQIAARAGSPIWSPDGRRLAFTIVGPRYRDLEVLSRKNGRIRRVARIEALRTLEPSWYGPQLVYSSQLSLSDAPLLWTVRPDGTGLHRLPNGAGGLDPSWSPDGSQIAFSGNGLGIDTMHADGSRLERVAIGKARWYSNPSWSPDGKTIAYSRTSHGIFVANLHSATSRAVLRTPGDDVPLSSEAWSRVGTKIAYSAHGDLDLIRTDGTGRTTLLQACCGAPAWAPDGSKLAFFCWTCAAGGSGIGIVDKDGSNLHGVVADRGSSGGSYPDLQAPSWSPDGRQLVFSGTSCTTDPDPQTGPPALCVISIDGTGLHALTPPGIGSFAPSWTAGSTRVAR